MSYVPPSYSEMLDILDSIMQNYDQELTELRLSQSQVAQFAHEIEGDIKLLNKQQKEEIRAALEPLSLKDVESQFWTFEGMKMLARFIDEMEREHGGDKASAVFASAQLNLENYFCFVFLRESLFEALSNKLKMTHNSSVLFKAAQFLLKDEVRILRNAFSHATWIVESSGRTNVLKYWDKKKEYTMSDKRWTFLRNMAHTISYVVIKNLQGNSQQMTGDFTHQSI